jgi:hypothetical protein
VRLAPITAGDIVEVDKKGRRIHGLVLAVEADGTVRFEPLQKGVSWRVATAREVVQHWTKAGRRKGQADPDVSADQLDLGLVPAPAPPPPPGLDPTQRPRRRR